jgi:hypothetical protein
VIAIRPHRLEHAAEPLFVADVVADQVAHAHSRLIGAFLRSNCISQAGSAESCSLLKAPYLTIECFESREQSGCAGQNRRQQRE